MPPTSRLRYALGTSRRGVLIAAVLAAGAAAGLGAWPALSCAASAANATAAASAANATAAASAANATAAASAANATEEPGSSLELAGQTSWVRGPSGLAVQLRIGTALPVSRLELKFVLYSRLTTRSAFNASVDATEPPSELPVDTPDAIPLAALDHRGSASGSVTVRFPVVTEPSTPSLSLASPKLDLDCGDQCDGVYPLEAALVDSSDGDVLATLTTHLIYTADTTGSLPLAVSLVLPSGTDPVLSSRGDATLSDAQLSELEQLTSALEAEPGVKVTLNLYPQVLVALERDRSNLAKAVLSSLDSLLTRRTGQHGELNPQVLGTTFAPVSAAALEGAGLGSELALQLDRGIGAINAGLGRSVKATPYVSYSPLDRSSLLLLEQDGVHELVVPSGDVTTLSGTPAPIVALTSPFRLVPSESGSGSGSQRPAVTTGQASGPVALVADAGLAAHFGADPDDPVLAAHQLIADLAEIYFNDPSDQDPRGVVVAPAQWTPDRAFLSTVLSALSDSPILESVSLGEAFQLPIGGNGSPRAEQLAQTAGGARSSLSASPTETARSDLRTVRSIVPGDKRLLASLGDAILEGESAALSRRGRAMYDAAPRDDLEQLSRSLTITGGRTITLTSRTGEIPITIVSTYRYAIHALTELRDSALDFLGTCSRPVLTILATKSTASECPVRARTSGDSRLAVMVVAPVGGLTLVSGSLKIQSTAVSGVAIALSIGALLVLGAWWLRSVLRHRRQKLSRAVALAAIGESSPSA